MRLYTLGYQRWTVRAVGNRHDKGGPTDVVNYEAGKAAVVALGREYSAVVLMCVCANLRACHRLEVATRLGDELGVQVEHVECPERYTIPRMF